MPTTETKFRAFNAYQHEIPRILDGSMTVFRRAVKWSNSDVSTPRNFLYDLSRAWSDPSGRDDGVHCYLHVPFAHPGDGWEGDPKNDMDGRWYPKFDEGDRLWLQETWQEVDDEYGTPLVVYKRGGYRIAGLRDGVRESFDAEAGEFIVDRWRPSIHMPCWASRITLEVTEVRVARVADIQPDDLRAEGFAKQLNDVSSTWFRRFSEYWDVLNKSRGFGWDTNPFVWVIEFRRICDAS